MHSSLFIRSGLSALAFGLAVVASGCAEDQKEITVTLAECPPAVQKTIIDHAGGIVFTKVERKIKSAGHIVYEVKNKTANGQEIKIKVAEDGSLVEFKTEDKK